MGKPHGSIAPTYTRDVHLVAPQLTPSFREAKGLQTTDDIQNWLLEESGVDVSHYELNKFRAIAGEIDQRGPLGSYHEGIRRVYPNAEWRNTPSGQTYLIDPDPNVEKYHVFFGSYQGPALIYGLYFAALKALSGGKHSYVLVDYYGTGLNYDEGVAPSPEKVDAINAQMYKEVMQDLVNEGKAFDLCPFSMGCMFTLKHLKDFLNIYPDTKVYLNNPAIPEIPLERALNLSADGLRRLSFVFGDLYRKVSSSRVFDPLQQYLLQEDMTLPYACRIWTAGKWTNELWVAAADNFDSEEFIRDNQQLVREKCTAYIGTLDKLAPPLRGKTFLTTYMPVTMIGGKRADLPTSGMHALETNDPVRLVMAQLQGTGTSVFLNMLDGEKPLFSAVS